MEKHGDKIKDTLPPHNSVEEVMEELIKAGAVYAFRYCILNKLDFSMESHDDDTLAANELYEEMWIDNNGAFKNEFTKMFKK